MESPAGKILFGFNKNTGELVDVIGPCRLTPETQVLVLDVDNPRYRGLKAEVVLVG
jgi:hypothetical protein